MAVRPPDSYREILAVSLPMIAAMAGRTIMMFCDRLFLAQHSQLELQASLPAGILSFTLICIFYGTVSYSGTFVAQYHGAGDRAGCSRAFAQGLYLTLFTAPMMAALAFPGSLLLDLAGHPAGVLELEKIYFRIMMYSGSGAVFTVAASAFWNGRGRTVPTMLAVFAGAALNVILDYAMIFGRWGFHETGIEGAAIATAISSYVPGIILTVAAYTGKTARRYKTREHFRYSKELTARIIRFGFPSGMQIFMDVASFTVFIFIVGRLSSVDFTANNLAFSVNNLAFNPLLGFGFATTVIVGRCIGMGDRVMAARVTHRSLVLSMLYYVPLALTFLLFPGFYTRLFFSPDSVCTIEELGATTGKLLAILAVWGIFDASNLIYSGALRGAGDTKYVMLVSSVLAWILWIPGITYLYAVQKAGIVTLWLFTSLYIAVFALAFILRFRTGVWKRIDLLGHGKVQN